MIRINLAIRKQASYLGGTSTKSGVLTVSGKSGSFQALRMFGGENNQTTIKRIMVPVVLSAILYFGSDIYVQQENERMQEEKAQVEVSRTNIQKELQRIKGFDTVKSELERNELILKTKIATIEKLIRGRDFTLKSIVALAQALPADVWLSEITVTDLIYNIRGSTTDIGLVSDVMTKLGKSIYFKDVTLKGSNTDVSGRIANFELTARKE